MPMRSLLEKSNSRVRADRYGGKRPGAHHLHQRHHRRRPRARCRAHRLLIGNLPGFAYSHDFFPQPGDMFWSPADWAWAGGLFDALLPSWNFGIPILGYRGRFDAEKAYYLLEKYGVRNSFLFPTALKLMMKAVPEPNKQYQPQPAFHHERGRVGRRHGDRMGARTAGRDHQRDVRPDRDQLRGRQLPGGLAGEARLDRPALSGPPGRGDRREGQRSAPRRTGRDRGR